MHKGIKTMRPTATNNGHKQIVSKIQPIRIKLKTKQLLFLTHRCISCEL